MIPEKGLPLLPSSTTRRQVSQAPRYRSLGDVDSEHEQLSMDPVRSPSVLVAHPPDELANFGLDARAATRPACARPLLPEQAKALAMPTDDGLRLHDHQGRRPPRP